LSGGGGGYPAGRISKQDLKDRIKCLEKEANERDEKAVLTFTKKELQEFIKKEISLNLIVEVNEGDSYQYGGGYKGYKEIKVSYDGEEVYTSSSWE